MKRFSVLLAGIVLASTLGAEISTAAPVCTWIRQPNGTLFGNCVDDNGRQFCVLCDSAGSNCNRLASCTRN